MPLPVRFSVLVCAFIVASSAAGQPALETEEQKTIYALGQALALSLQTYALTEEELEIFKAGLTDGVLGREAKVNVDEYKTQLQALGNVRSRQAAKAEKEASAKLLENLAATEGAQTSASGLIFIEIEPGTGAQPVATDVVQVHYHGTLRDGTVFDSSVQRGEPATFPLNRVIPCWTEGVQKMKVGGKAKIVCPSDIAYGDQGRLPTIKPGATLIFEVELLNVQSPPAPG